MYGNEQQKQKYLPLLTSGEWMAAVCISEAGSGTDPAVIETSAELVEDNYIINGKKMWVTNATKANLFIVLTTQKVSYFPDCILFCLYSF